MVVEEVWLFLYLLGLGSPYHSLDLFLPHKQGVNFGQPSLVLFPEQVGPVFWFKLFKSCSRG